MDMEPPITVRFLWTANELCLGYHYHFRHICRPTIRFGLHAIFALVLCGGALACMQERGWGLVAPLVAVWVGLYWFFIRGYAFRWAVRRQFAKRPDKNAEIEWQIAADKLTVRSSLGYSEFSWRALAKVLRTPQGLMLYPFDNLFHWLPRHSFLSDAEFDRAADLARTMVPRFYIVR